MTKISHHPADATLAAFAAGTLEVGCRVVVAAHLELCPACRKAVSGFEAVGGAHLKGLSPAELRPRALAFAMAALDAESPEADRTQYKDQLPRAVNEFGVGKWRWIGIGVEWRAVDVPVENDIRVFMLRAAGGTRLPHHRHLGIEWTCILQGAYSHELGRYGPGDFDEADETMEHKPVVDDGEPCICLVALQRNIQLQSFMGRLLQPLIRI